MTREKEKEVNLDEYTRLVESLTNSNNHFSLDDIKNAFREGFEQADKSMINKACK